MSRQPQPFARSARAAVFGVALLATFFVAGTYAAPLLDSAGSSGGALLRLLYAPVCHQLPERSIEIGTGTQAVCSRCAGLYLGGIAGLVAAGLFVVGRRAGPRPVWLLIAVAPTVIDALLHWSGIGGLPLLQRHYLAWPAGFAAGLLLAVGIADLVSSRFAIRACGPPGLRTESILEGTDG